MGRRVLYCECSRSLQVTKGRLGDPRVIGWCSRSAKRTSFEETSERETAEICPSVLKFDSGFRTMRKKCGRSGDDGDRRGRRENEKSETGGVPLPQTSQDKLPKGRV